jgi:hypothetical protein
MARVFAGQPKSIVRGVSHVERIQERWLIRPVLRSTPRNYLTNRQTQSSLLCGNVARHDNSFNPTALSFPFSIALWFHSSYRWRRAAG